MYAALLTAMGKIPGARMVAFGTRPADPDHWFGKLLAGGAAYAQVHRDQLVQHMVAACGVRVDLVSSSDGTGAREGWRRFPFGSVVPLGRLVSAELADKLDMPGLTLAWDELRAADVTGRPGPSRASEAAEWPLRRPHGSPGSRA